MATYVYECPVHGRVEVAKPMTRAGEDEWCARCLPLGPVLVAPMRRVYTPQRLIMRPSGYRLRPGDRGFDDFRRELELGEIREDPSPVRLTPEELARADEMPLALPPDPERDHQLAQLINQHWTEDLSDDTVRRRELEAQHHGSRQPQPAA